MQWEARPVSFSERGPIAAFQLRVIEECHSKHTLDDLDKLDLIALVEIDEEVQTVVGLAYMSRIEKDPGAVLADLFWMKKGTPEEGIQTLLRAMDRYAYGHGAGRILCFVAGPMRILKRWHFPHGFVLTNLKQLQRTIDLAAIDAEDAAARPALEEMH